MVRIDDPDVMDRLCAVEGDGFRALEATRVAQHEQLGYALDYSLEGARRKRAERQQAIADGDDPALYEYDSDIVYGLGGWHRYFVRSSGEVVFSRYHATETGIRNAEAAGFRVE